jgi:thioester reductase-like protein
MSGRLAFVTGFPGFISRRLIAKLLASDDDLSVVALVEESRLQDAEAAIEEMVQLNTSNVFRTDRMELVSGDVSALDAGLSGEEFRRITTSATEVYHLAAVHSLSADRRSAERVNVVGTSNILGLARAMPRLERFVHFSSAYVSGDRTGVIMEDELEEGQSFRNAYEATKHQSEALVRRARDRLPVTIIRPSGVVGDSRTGEIDRFDSVYHLGMLLVASPLAIPVPMDGQGSAPLNLVPVDYVVDAVHAIVNREGTVGGTFHIVDPNPLSARRVYDTIAERAGKPRPRLSVSTNLTKVLLRIPGLERFAAVSHQAVDYLNHMAFYNARNTADALDGTGIRCPPFEDYVENLMQYVRDYFERAGRFS